MVIRLRESFLPPVHGKFKASCSLLDVRLLFITSFPITVTVEEEREIIQAKTLKNDMRNDQL